ncbi:MAG: carboxypeptidase regulatory-like domain-containing protein [Crocinitomicaceae bacterium]|nr:carboxypeptidase regulatory-like domain-containing protein [Crocinitomicaceae bacterium]
MKTKIYLTLAALFCAGMVSAQVNLGKIKGKITDDNGQVIPMAKVWIEGQGNINRMLADVEGTFTFNALTPGIYILHSTSTGKDTTTLNTIEVKPDEITDLGSIALLDDSNMLGPFIYTYTEPLIKKDVAKISIPTEDIEHSLNIRDPKALFVSMNSDIQMVEGTSDVIIRGSRPGDAVYYIDGVKTQDLNGVPGVGIGSMTGYTGGIPAKYGDTTGGVIVLETKSYFDLYYAWLAGNK